MNQSENVQKMISKLTDLKCAIVQFKENNSLNDAKERLSTFVQTARDEIKTFATGDLKDLKKRFEAEKRQVESFIEKTLNAEVKKAKSFIKEQKSELHRVQKDLEKIIKVSVKAPKKKKPAAKKATRKVAKK